ncbi:MAG: hypothetical protein QMD46_04920 [Methanomicrobiales archaeon]|nr:hypothetical protein [Methanomicrobiales archaeon]
MKTRVFRPPSPARPVPILMDEILQELESCYIDMAVARDIAAEMQRELSAARFLLDAGDLEGAKKALARARSQIKEFVITLRMVQASRQSSLPPSTARNLQAAKHILENALDNMVRVLP